HVQHTVCTPSRCSFMTGWYPHTRGHRTLWHCLQPDEPNTLKYLKQAGYEVHWMGKNDLLAPASFADSVTRVHHAKNSGGRESLFERDDPAYMSFLRGPMNGHHIDYEIVQNAITFLKERPADAPPFMLFLATALPHCPYTVPQPWYDMYDPGDIPPLRPCERADKPVFQRLIREYRRLDEVDDFVFRKIMAVYLGMISYVDHLLGMVLDALDDTGLTEDTAFFFFSDHGDWAGDYGLVEKWPSGLDDCLTRIPMIIQAPENAAGHVVNEPIECFDIMPTTLELAGVDVQHTHYARSLLPQLQGAKGDPSRAVFAEGGYDRHEPQCFEGSPDDGLMRDPNGIYYPKGRQQQEHPESVARAAMIRTATHKLIWRPNDTHELYDLARDPNELNNVYMDTEYQPVRELLINRMMDWYVHTADAVPFHRDPRGFPPDG
ncbi:MAG: sulfatase-like hydrolase/transferase, partial [Candidatus Pacebacteria bacterium]|nr:sulfatase-like hydrolase/transferase [Candidatus Paceibacterota bacterium]